MRANWKKYVAILAMVLAAILAAVAARNNVVVSYSAEDGGGGSTFSWIAGTGLTGLGSIAALFVSAFLSWKQKGKANPTLLANMASLSELGGACVLVGDSVGLKMVGDLAVHFQEWFGLNPPAPVSGMTQLAELAKEVADISSQIKGVTK